MCYLLYCMIHGYIYIYTKVCDIDINECILFFFKFLHEMSLYCIFIDFAGILN